MDYGDFLVHVFQDEARAYYDLERLWGNAPRRSADGARRRTHRRRGLTPHAPTSGGQRRELRRGGHRHQSTAGDGHLHRLAVELEGDAGHARPERRSGEHDLGHRLDLRGADELAEGPAQVDRGDAAGDVGAEDGGLGRERALQPRRGLGVGGSRPPAPGGPWRGRGARPTRCESPPRDRPLGSMRIDLHGDLDGRRRGGGRGRRLRRGQEVEGDAVARQRGRLPVDGHATSRTQERQRRRRWWR